MNIIPAIDLKDGACVRLFKGDFEQTTEYSREPLAVAQRFSELSVAELHIVDLDGARTGAQQNQAVVEDIARQTRLAIQIGGGIRDTRTLLAWLDRGVTRCVVGSLAVTEPATVEEWLDEFGPERVVLALDVNIGEDGVPMLTTHGWTRPSTTSLWDGINRYRDSGLKHLLCTDVSRDGALAGPNLELYAQIVARYPALRLQASGGVRSIDDMTALRAAGVPAAITGRALLDGRITAEEIRSFRQDG